MGGATLTLVVSPLLVIALATNGVSRRPGRHRRRVDLAGGIALIGLYVILAASVWWGPPIAG